MIKIGVPLLSLFIPIQDAIAQGGKFVVLEGRIASMLHPVTMLVLFGTSLFILQWNLGLTMEEVERSR
jgi:hypothetical protein